MVGFQLEHLRTLIAAVDEGTFEAAAARLHITPSAVSQRIKAMEQSAGRILVHRATPIAPTDAGDIVLRHARQVHLLSLDAGRELGIDPDGDDADAQPLSIPLAVNADSLATWFMAALQSLSSRTDAVFDVRRDDQEHTAELLRQGQVMAAVTAEREPVQGCLTVPLGVMRYRAVCHPSLIETRLGGDADVRGVDRLPMVNFDRKDDLQHRFVRSVLRRESRAPRHFIPTSAEFAVAVDLGLGWGLLPEQQCRAQLADGRLVELRGAGVVEMPLYWQRWNLKSALLDALTDAVTAAARGSLTLET